MAFPSTEELKTNEDARLNFVMEGLDRLSELHEKMSMNYLEIISKHEQERREILKYLGAIAGGAAALAPQLLHDVKQPVFFYGGIGLLCIVTVISVTYTISCIETELNAFKKNLDENNKMFDKIRKPKEDFIKNKDHSVTAFTKALLENEQNIPAADKEIKKGWYTPMDYTSEFIILLTVTGLAFIVLGLNTRTISWKYIILTEIIIFIIINLISTFPRQFFTKLGSPISLIKSLLRLLKRG